MRMTPVYNMSLLAEIRKAKKISYEELWKILDNRSKAIFDSDLATLVSMGCIKIEDDTIVFIYTP